MERLYFGQIKQLIDHQLVKQLVAWLQVVTSSRLNKAIATRGHLVEAALSRVLDSLNEAYRRLSRPEQVCTQGRCYNAFGSIVINDVQ